MVSLSRSARSKQDVFNQMQTVSQLNRRTRQRHVPHNILQSKQIFRFVNLNWKNTTRLKSTFSPKECTRYRRQANEYRKFNRIFHIHGVHVLLNLSIVLLWKCRNTLARTHWFTYYFAVVSNSGESLNRWSETATGEMAMEVEVFNSIGVCSLCSVLPVDNSSAMPYRNIGIIRRVRAIIIAHSTLL